MAANAKLPTVTILGRDVTFRAFNDTQRVLIHRMRQMLKGALAQLPDRDIEAEEELNPQETVALDSLMETTAKFLDMLGYMVVSDEDRDWLMTQMLAGNLDLDTISAFVPHLTGPDDAAKKPAKKAVRAR